jgi:vitamin K-dependent gamma-carboxylase
MSNLARRLFQPVDIASLIAFRIAFGVLMLIAIARYFAHGWIDLFFVQPRVFFPYPGFEWIAPLPAPAMYALFVALAVLALFVAVGWRYRISIALFGLGFTYVHLIDRTNYLNHYYLISLLSALLVFVPAHRACSLDARRCPELRARKVPAWAVWLLRFQLGTVYVFGAVAKLNPDWLLRAQPLRIWLGANVDLPLIGPWMELPWVGYVASYAGLLFDSAVVPLLLCRRTRVLAYVGVLIFHLLTALLFRIGMFPWIMIALTPIFFAPEWPRRIVGGAVASFGPSAVSPRPTAWRYAGVVLASVYMLAQVVLPLRHFVRSGNVYWTEDGFRWSWQIMVMEKYGRASFRVTDVESGETRRVEPSQYLTRLQQFMLATQPDVIRSFALYLADETQRRGRKRPQVRADVFVTWNGRPNRRLIDPNVDLARSEVPAGWILPAVTAPADRAQAGTNLGIATSSSRSSNTTRTGMPMRMSDGATPSRLEINLGPSRNLTRTTAYGTSAANPG